MRLPKFRYAVLSGGIFGLITPLAVMALSSRGIVNSIAGIWLLFIWPSFILLITAGSLADRPRTFTIVGISVGCNVLIYVIVFTLIWLAGWVLRAWRASLRDGTTI
jgi:hypothetical protein